MKQVFVVSLLLVTNIAFAQAFVGSFDGWWARTDWRFEFKPVGTFQRTSTGHYGNTIVNGTYEMQGDTIRVLTGSDNTDGTLRSIYVLDTNGFLIDLRLRYDYAPVAAGENNYHNSRIRQVKYPQLPARNAQQIRELENLLNQAFNSETVKAYLHFSELPQRQFLIADYDQLQADIRVDDRSAIFLPADQIHDPFYIAFEDIDFNEDQASLKLVLHGEGVNIWLYYERQNGKWVALEPYVSEN